jgi:SAM-dependent methyltransferase
MSAVDRARAVIYDTAIVRMTAAWYRAVLTRLPDGCRLLDIGIGTGSALLANADLVVAKQLRITGVDVDAAYVERCARAVTDHRLDGRIAVRRQSIYDHRDGPYDAAYFSASFMLLPDPAAALRHVGGLLAPGGRIYFTQTFEHQRSRAVERLKPLLRLVTTIDFGRVTYEDDFRRALAAGGVALEAFEVLHASPRRSAVLAVAHGGGPTSGSPRIP